MTQSLHEHVNPAIVRSYDIRGPVDTDLCNSDASALGLAFAASAHSRNLLRLAVCRDGRLSSARLEQALIEGLLAGGMHVYALGLGPTPLLHYGVRAIGLDGGIMVTGSHNPRDENGFKLLLDGEPVYGDALHQLVATAPVPRTGGRTCEAPYVYGPNSPVPGAARVGESYVRYLAGIGRSAPARRVVWDCGHGAMGPVVTDLVERIPGSHILVNCRVDGRFPAHHPDPSVAANLEQLQTAVLRTQADVGFAFDGDGDRIGVVDSTGEIVWPDQLLLYLGRQILADHPGATIVGDVKSSQVLFDGIRDFGGQAVMAPSGYVLVREALLEGGARLAGEMSGHILFADSWHRTDDALFAALRVLVSIGRQNQTLAEFRKGLPSTVATPEVRLVCSEHRKSAVVREVGNRLRLQGADIDTTDGLRVTTTDGWWLLRRSGTESKLTARCEARSVQGLESLKHQLAVHLSQSGVDVSETPLEGDVRKMAQ